MAKSSDFLKKQPSKNEKVFSEITMYLHDIDHRIWSVASQVLAMGLSQNISPKAMAELLTGGDEKLQAYAKEINEEIKKIEGDRKPEAGHEGHNHDHGHHTHPTDDTEADAEVESAEIENAGDAESPEEISEIES